MHKFMQISTFSLFYVQSFYVGSFSTFCPSTFSLSTFCLSMFRPSTFSLMTFNHSMFSRLMFSRCIARPGVSLLVYIFLPTIRDLLPHSILETFVFLLCLYMYVLKFVTPLSLKMSSLHFGHCRHFYPDSCPYP